MKEGCGNRSALFKTRPQHRRVGRPQSIALEHAYVLDKDSNRITDTGAQAGAELNRIAIAEHSRIRGTGDLCDDYNQHAADASTIRALYDTPVDHAMAKPDLLSLFSAAQTDPACGPDLTIDDFQKRDLSKRYSLAYFGQFHYGVFYAFLKLKEIEIANITQLCQIMQLK